MLDSFSRSPPAGSIFVEAIAGGAETRLAAAVAAAVLALLLDDSSVGLGLRRDDRYSS